MDTSLEGSGSGHVVQAERQRSAGIRVLIVAEDPLARAGLAALLAGQAECIVAGQVASMTDLPEAAKFYRPDVILWDLGWEPSEGLSALDDEEQELATGLPALAVRPGDTLPIVALIPIGPQGHAAEAWMAGVHGLLPRDASAEVLVAALSAAVQGLVVFDPAVAPPLSPPHEGGEIGSLVLPYKGGEAGSQVEALTPREVEVLQLLAEGLPNKSIARRLGISDHTVKFHVNAILGKLGAQSRTDAVVRATRLGLIIL